jgi:hypothetical protein
MIITATSFLILGHTKVNNIEYQNNITDGRWDQQHYPLSLKYAPKVHPL